jgi:thioredoxin-related protein
MRILIKLLIVILFFLSGQSLNASNPYKFWKKNEVHRVSMRKALENTQKYLISSSDTIPYEVLINTIDSVKKDVRISKRYKRSVLVSFTSLKIAVEMHKNLNKELKKINRSSFSTVDFQLTHSFDSLQWYTNSIRKTIAETNYGINTGGPAYQTAHYSIALLNLTQLQLRLSSIDSHLDMVESKINYTNETIYQINATINKLEEQVSEHELAKELILISSLKTYEEKIQSIILKIYNEYNLY